MMRRSQTPVNWSPYLPWFDVVAIGLWGGLLLRYWSSGQLRLLIHPNYDWLVIVTGFALVVASGVRGYHLWRQLPSASDNLASLQHLNLLPSAWSRSLLIASAVVGLIISPQAFASQTAIHRGVVENMTMMTQVKPQAFRGASPSQDRSLIEWIRTLQVYPEPDAYTGQKAKLQGFVVYPPNLPEQYFLLTRFVITCCAADAYPVSLPVKFPQDSRRQAFKVDQWLEVTGVMITDTLEGKRRLVVQADTLQPISQPKNPYDY
jgi:uncharacterized repeat protein (TIGR03943 family)